MDFVLISKEHAHATREMVRARQGMWDDVAFGLKKSGDAAMENGPWSVTWSDRVAPSGNPHDYFSEGTYFWQNPADPDGPYLHLDGQANPNRFHQHLDEFGWLADTVLDLVLWVDRAGTRRPCGPCAGFSFGKRKVCRHGGRGKTLVQRHDRLDSDPRRFGLGRTAARQ